MTVTADTRASETDVHDAEPPAEPPVGPVSSPGPPPTAAPSESGGSRSAIVARIVLTVALTAALLLAFLAYLLAFSGISMNREQTNLRKTFNQQLANAVAPVGPVRAGSPVAALDIPALDIATMIVVEGTTSRNLMSGPGHLPASVLPGQAGTSIVYGKRTTFGAPFANLAKLRVGDRIRVTTGQGVATYVVSSFGDMKRPAPANSANRLVLYSTSDTLWSADPVMVSADLLSAPKPSPGGRPAVVAEQRPGARDVTDSLIPLAGWSQLLLLTALIGTVGLLRWPRWPVVLCLGPVLVAVLWSVFENAAGLLPNLL